MQIQNPKARSPCGFLCLHLLPQKGQLLIQQDRVLQQTTLILNSTCAPAILGICTLVKLLVSGSEADEQMTSKDKLC